MHKKIQLSIGIILLFLCMSITQSVAIDNIEQSTMPISNGKILYVGGSGEGNYTTIQRAINDASEGDTVFVYNRKYYESVIINVNNLKLIGENCKDTIIINYDGYNGVMIEKDINGVTVSGFTVKTHDYNNKGDAGIRLWLSSFNNYIMGNILMDNRHGISIWSDSSNNYISDNIITDCGIGIYIFTDNSNNIISNNTINNCGNCIYIQSDGLNNIIKNNIITNSEMGIEINDYTFNTNISNNFINNNEIGIYAEMVIKNFKIKRNIIIDNQYGIILDFGYYESYGNISMNIIDSNNVGIYIMGGTKYKISIYKNNITNNRALFNSCGIFVDEGHRFEIICNNFINNRPNARFKTLFYCKTLWNANFWDKPRDSPYIIIGRNGLIFYLRIFPWLQFDKNPAQEPHDIS